ncbi:hypothetical protein [Paeniglutamicibacter sp.]|uniref:hypothetical protein n=1 Tax=Paeniglutamicibacter sp. TaxID=1934391 RepID=UPI00398A4560
MNEIEPAAYKFTTASGSLYLLDVTDGVTTLTRLPGEFPPEVSLGDSPAALVRDEHAILVQRILQFGVGRNGIFVLDLRRDGIPTIRATSPIRSIEKLAGPTESARG